MSYESAMHEHFNEVWISILTAINTALLVNILTVFKADAMFVSQVFLLCVGCISLAFYARKRSLEILRIEELLIRKNIQGLENTKQRYDFFRNEWRKSKTFLTSCFVISIVCVALSIGLLIYKGYAVKNVEEQGNLPKEQIQNSLQEK